MFNGGVKTFFWGGGEKLLLEGGTLRHPPPPRMKPYVYRVMFIVSRRCVGKELGTIEETKAKRDSDVSTQVFVWFVFFFRFPFCVGSINWPLKSTPSQKPP